MVTGIIYKIQCNVTGEVYYGSTQYSLNKRITEHKSQCKRWKEGKTNYTTSFQIIERGNYSYSLIETVDCEDRKQLETRERMFIETNECINKTIPCRTMKEWYDENQDTIIEQRKTNYSKNKVQVKEHMKEYRHINRDVIKDNVEPKPKNSIYYNKLIEIYSHPLLFIVINCGKTMVVSILYHFHHLQKLIYISFE